MCGSKQGSCYPAQINGSTINSGYRPASARSHVQRGSHTRLLSLPFAGVEDEDRDSLGLRDCLSKPIVLRWGPLLTRHLRQLPAGARVRSWR